MPTLVALLVLFGSLSIVSFGGGNATIGAMQRAVVDRHHWVTDTQFLDLFALSRAAPGPGSLIAALIGRKAAGVPGALVATIGMIGPSCLVVFVAASFWRRHAGGRIRFAIERAVSPIAIGLTVGSALAIARHDEHGAVFDLITVGSAAVLTLTRTNPLLVMGLCALAAALA